MSKIWFLKALSVHMLSFTELEPFLMDISDTSATERFPKPQKNHLLWKIPSGPSPGTHNEVVFLHESICANREDIFALRG